MRYEAVCKNGHQYAVSDGEPTNCDACGSPPISGVAVPLPDLPFQRVTGGARRWRDSVEALVTLGRLSAEAAAAVSVERAMRAVHDCWVANTIVAGFIAMWPEEAIAKLRPSKFKRSKELLQVDMTETQLAAAAREMAAISRAIDEVELEKKESMTIFKARLEGHIKRMSEVSAGVREGQRVMTEVVIELDYRAGRVIKVRSDTGEVIEDRVMTGEERQQDMFAESRKRRRRDGDEAQAA